MAYDDLVAQFLANGGKVQKVPSGATALDLSPSAWNKAIREPGTVQSRAREADAETERKSYAKWEAAQQAHFMGDHAEGYRIMDEE